MAQRPNMFLHVIDACTLIFGGVSRVCTRLPFILLQNQKKKNWKSFRHFGERGKLATLTSFLHLEEYGQRERERERERERATQRDIKRETERETERV
jgi:hypothetical protein